MQLDRSSKCTPAWILLLYSFCSSYAIASDQHLLRLLVWEGYAPEEQRQEFKDFILAKYEVDLKLEVDYITTAEDGFEALRLQKADIVSPAHNRINDKRFRMIDLGLILPINLDHIPNYQDLNPSFKHLSHLVKNRKHYGLPFAWGPYGLVYNTKLFETPPSSWNTLWAAHFNNKLSIADYGEINIYITALALGYEINDIGNFEKLNNKLFRDKLGALVANAKSLWVGVDSADDLQNLTLASSWGFALPELKSRGELWSWAHPVEGVPGWIDNHVISHSLKDKPILKRIAEEWINYTISVEFQAKVLVEALGTHPVNQVTADLSTPEQKQAFYAESFDDAEASIMLMPELDRRTRNGMDILWKEALTNQHIKNQSANIE